MDSNKPIKGFKTAMGNFLNRVYRFVTGEADDSNFKVDSWLDEVLGKAPVDKEVEVVSTRYAQLQESIANGSVKETLRGTSLRNSTRGLTPVAKTKLKNEALERATSMTDTVKDSMKVVFKEAADRDLSLAETKALLKERFVGMVEDGKIDTIARTEYNNAYGYGQNHAVEKLEKKGAKVTRTWRTSGTNVRDSHAKCEGEERGVGQAFSNGLLYPGDPSGGPEEVINCNCYLEIEVKETEGDSNEE